MTAQEIVDQLKPLGLESYKRTMLTHGAKEPLYGVKIEELKKFQKQIKKDYQLSKDLYDTGIYDAMYLAGLVADETKMTAADIEAWLAGAKSLPIAEFTVPWIASESAHGRELGLKWIESNDVSTASAGWQTLNGYVALRPDSELDLEELRGLLKRVEDSIHSQPNRVKMVMNSFVIAVGASVGPLADEAMRTAEAIGKVSVELVGSCKIAFAPEYIKRAWDRGGRGKKRKTVRC
jgi:hypothetical protein